MSSTLHRNPTGSEKAQNVVERYALRVLVGTTLVSGFFGFLVLQRTQRFQVRRIQRTLQESKNRIYGLHAERYSRDYTWGSSYGDSTALKFRPEIAESLEIRLTQAPRAPLLVTGPEGVGKATLVAHALYRRPMTLYLNLSHQHARSGDAFLRAFADITGFWLTPSGMFVRSLLRARESKQRISADDTDACFMALQEALRRERDRGWLNGVPVICVEELHDQGRDMLDVKDMHVRRFLDWSMFITGAQLAHVVFLTSVPVGKRLDKSLRFRHDREVLYIDYLGDEHPAIQEVLGQHSLSEQQCKHVCDNVGGNMGDISRVLAAVKQGTSCEEAVRHRVDDAVQQLEHIMAWHIQEIVGAATPALRTSHAARLVRFWRLLEVVHSAKYILKKEVEATVLYAFSNELDNYIKHGVMAHAVLNHEAAARLMRPQDEILLERSPGHPSEAAFAITTTWPNVFISAGSPRMHVAFGRVVSQKHQQQKHAWAAAIVDEAELQNHEKHMVTLAKTLRSRASDAEKNREVVAEGFEEWARLYGEGGAEVLTRQWKDSFAQAAEYRAELQEVEDDLHALRHSLQRVRTRISSYHHQL